MHVVDVEEHSFYRTGRGHWFYKTNLFGCHTEKLWFTRRFEAAQIAITFDIICFKPRLQNISLDLITYFIGVGT